MEPYAILNCNKSLTIDFVLNVTATSILLCKIKNILEKCILFCNR